MADTNTTAPAKPQNTDEQEYTPSERKVQVIIQYMIYGGLIMLVMINARHFWFPGTAKFSDQLAAMFTGFGYALLIAGAFFGLGALVGFLFGIPRIPEAEKNSTGGGLAQNDNLVQISDWLTKIIVGVGLTQINEIYPALLSLGKTMAPNFGGGDIGLGVNLAIGTILYFVITGFLSGYLWTRIHFYRLLAQTSGDVKALEKQLNEANEQKAQAEAEKEEAEKQRIAMEEKKRIAEAESQEAEKQRLLMEEEKRKAEAEMEEAKKNEEKKQRELQALNELTKTDRKLKSDSQFISDDRNDDPNAGKFGGLAEANGRRLQANVGESSFDPDRFFVELEILSTDNNKPLEGDVKIFLHPATFNPSERVLPVLNGSVHLDLFAWGSFTVGAECDGGQTKLELDLSKIPGVPQKFAER